MCEPSPDEKDTVSNDIVNNETRYKDVISPPTIEDSSKDVSIEIVKDDISKERCRKIKKFDILPSIIHIYKFVRTDGKCQSCEEQDQESHTNIDEYIPLHRKKQLSFHEYEHTDFDTIEELDQPRKRIKTNTIGIQEMSFDGLCITNERRKPTCIRCAVSTTIERLNNVFWIDVHESFCQVEDPNSLNDALICFTKHFSDKANNDQLWSNDVTYFILQHKHISECNRCHDIQKDLHVGLESLQNTRSDNMLISRIEELTNMYFYQSKHNILNHLYIMDRVFIILDIVQQLITILSRE